MYCGVNCVLSHYQPHNSQTSCCCCCFSMLSNRKSLWQPDHQKKKKWRAADVGQGGRVSQVRQSCLAIITLPHQSKMQLSRNSVRHARSMHESHTAKSYSQSSHCERSSPRSFLCCCVDTNTNTYLAFQKVSTVHRVKPEDVVPARPSANAT